MNYTVQFLLVLAAASLSCVKVTLQGRASRSHIRTLADSVWFNVLLFGCIALLFLLLFPIGEVDGTIVLFGVVLGVSTVVAQVSYAFAFNTGPVSLTVLIANFSILVSTLFSAFAFGEKMYLSQMAGIGFMLAAMFLNRASDGDAKATRKWLMFALLVMLAFGVGNSLQKLFWITESSAKPNSDVTLMVVMYICATLIALAVYGVISRTGRRQKSALRFTRPAVGYAALIGASLCAYQKVCMYALSNIDGTFYFPTAAGLQSLLMTLVGVALFRDRLSKKQKLGVVCGVICVALMNIRIGPAIQF